MIFKTRRESELERNLEIAKKNQKILNEHLKELKQKNVAYQEEILELKEKLKKKEVEYLRRCPKCNKYFTASKTSRKVYCDNCRHKKKGDK